jgi:hypothetical protein
MRLMEEVAVSILPLGIVYLHVMKAKNCQQHNSSFKIIGDVRRKNKPGRIYLCINPTQHV